MTESRVDPDRPTGDEMLARVATEQRAERGRLRVYLGMAPGVGKTFRMLEEAHRRKDRGTDVVIGFVEPHGRPRTAALLEGLETLPRLQIRYRDVIVEEMDTDAVVERHPQVAIIDELAHTNVPGSPREKRWEDVGIVLDHGIDVISTCNVQHLESVADAVQTITGAPVNERLPDEVLEAADEVELVDMSPHALRQRIRHGNVYPPDRARIALDRFFTEPNLTSLRELSLRFVTHTVDEDLEEMVASRGLGRLPPVTERVIVSVDERPITRRALRRGAALASALQASLVGAVIETPEVTRLPFDRQRDLQENADFAADLGAEIVRLQAPDLASGLEQLARSRRITHIVLPRQPRQSTMVRLRRSSPEEQLLERLPGLELHLVAEGEEAAG